LYVLAFVPTYVAWELNELERRGVTVRVVVPAAWPRASMWNEISGGAHGAGNGVDVRSLDFHHWLVQPARALVRPGAGVLARLTRRRSHLVPRFALRCLREGTSRHFLAAGELDEMFGEGEIGRVHAHFATDAAHVGALLARLRGVPFTLTTHAHDIFVPRAPHRLRSLLAGANRVLTISHFNRAHLERVAGRDIAARVRVLHLGVDAETLPPWKPAADVFTIAATASGLGEKKGVAVLLEACRLLRLRGVRLRCQICGGDPRGERLAALRSLVREKGLGSDVSLLGAIPWRRAQALVAGASVFVHPSVRTPGGDMDGIPVSVIEAMGIGVPVVSSRLSGIPELIDDGRSGTLVAPGDASALADAVERVARDPASAATMAARGRERVRDAFRLSRYVDGLLDVWRETG
jgi:glycosyltransferase involved in cell wall biosynthesis